MRYSTAGQIDTAVRALYQKNGCVVLSEVRNGTGLERRVRTADMMIVSTWPSRGLYCEGVEVKVSRSDLQSELANPKKADDLAKYCRRWWLAIPDDMKLEGLMVPETWGIITVDEKGKASACGGQILAPLPMDTLMVCSILRNFAESHTHNSEVEGRIKSEVKAAVNAAHDYRDRRLADLEAAIKKFADVSGVEILGRLGNPTWELGNIGEAVGFIRALKTQPAEVLKKAADGLRAASAAIETAMEAIGMEESAKVVGER